VAQSTKRGRVALLAVAFGCATLKWPLFPWCRSRSKLVYSTRPIQSDISSFMASFPVSSFSPTDGKVDARETNLTFPTLLSLPSTRDFLHQSSDRASLLLLSLVNTHYAGRSTLAVIRLPNWRTQPLQAQPYLRRKPLSIAVHTADAVVLKAANAPTRSS
jgi:hypothetical protein